MTQVFSFLLDSLLGRSPGPRAAPVRGRPEPAPNTGIPSQATYPILQICRQVIMWSSSHPHSTPFSRFLFLMLLFPLNNFDPAERQSRPFFLSYDFKHDEIMQRDIMLIQPQKLLTEHVRNLCQYWRYAFRLMVFSPGKIFDALDEVVICRWFVFVKDPMQRCAGFWRHAFPIGMWLIIWQLTFGIQARLYARMEDYSILLALLSALFECLTINKNTTAQAIPLGLSAMIQEPLPADLLQLYTHMFHYLEVCAILVAKVTQTIPPVDRARGILRGWPGMILIQKAIDNTKDSFHAPQQARGRAEPIVLIPTYEYFESKVLAVWGIASDITDAAFKPHPTRTQNRELTKMRERCGNGSVEHRMTSITGPFRKLVVERGSQGNLQGIPIDVDQLKEWATASIDSIGFLVTSLRSGEKKEIELEVQNASFPLLVFKEVAERERKTGESDGVIAFCADPDEDE